MTVPGTSDSQPARDERRWTLCEGTEFDGEWSIEGPGPQPGERVVVMPVAAHEAALTAARQVTDEKVREAAKAINELPAVLIGHAMEGKPQAEEAIARAALLAALNPSESAVSEPEGEQ